MFYVVLYILGVIFTALIIGWSVGNDEMEEEWLAALCIIFWPITLLYLFIFSLYKIGKSIGGGRG